MSDKDIVFTPSSRWTDEQLVKAWSDFRYFVFIVWYEIGLPAPTPIQLDMANVLQNPPSDRYIIQGFRGVAKSFLTCAYAVWLLWKNPLLKILITSASKDRADANAIFIRKIINTLDFLECLRLTSEDKLTGLRDTQNLFDVKGAIPDISPSIKSVGITGQITGTRADVLISDDVEVPSNSATPVQRDKLSEAVKEYDAILKPNGQIIYLGTPQNEASLYNALQERGYLTMIWTVMYPKDKTERDFYGDKLAPYIANRFDKDPDKYAGQPTEPTRFNEEEIEKRRLSYGKAGFALQFMLNTSLSDYDKYPLKVSDFIVEELDNNETSRKWVWGSSPTLRINDVPCVALRGDYFYMSFSRSPETMAYTGTVMSIDGSGRGSDLTAYAVVKFINGYLCIMDVGGYTEGYEDTTLNALANKAKFWNVNDVVVEANFGDGMLTKLLTPVFNRIYPCGIQEVKHSKQKELRIIDTLEPLLMQHRLILNKSVITQDYRRYEVNPLHSLIYQLTRISKERNSLAHDDLLDALAIACHYWIEAMDVDSNKVEVEEFYSFIDRQFGVQCPLVMDNMKVFR